jgi:hypothetical protein
MKCEPCGFQSQPDNETRLLQHLQTCQIADLEKATIVWRDGQLTATYKKKTKEKVFEDLKTQKLPDPEIPPVFVPVTEPGELTFGETTL